MRGGPTLPLHIRNYIIDIDGVICEDVPNEEPARMITAKPIPGSKEQINKWYDEGHIISLFTSRTEEHREITEEWLKRHGIKYHYIIFGKPRGGNYYYIDDKEIKAFKFNGSLSETLNE